MDEVETYPSLYSVGEYIDKPKYVVFLDTDEENKYSITEEQLDACKDSTNDMIHFIRYRNQEGITVDEAVNLCCAEQPNLILIDCEDKVDYISPYITVH